MRFLIPTPRRRQPVLPISGPFMNPDGGPGPYYEDAEGKPCGPITGPEAEQLRRQALEHRR